MVITTKTDVLVISTGPLIEPALERVVLVRQWPVMVQPSRSQLLREVRLIRPQVLLFQVSASPDLEMGLSLISTLRAYRPDVPRIALAFALDDRLETRLRAAGAQVYLHVSGSSENLEQALDHLRLSGPPAARASPDFVVVHKRGPPLPGTV